MISSRPNQESLKQDDIDSVIEKTRPKSEPKLPRLKKKPIPSARRQPLRNRAASETKPVAPPPTPVRKARRPKPKPKIPAPPPKIVTEEVIERPLLRAKSVPTVVPPKKSSPEPELPLLEPRGSGQEPQTKTISPSSKIEEIPQRPVSRPVSRPVLTIPDPSIEEKLEAVVHYQLAGTTKRLFAFAVDSLILLLILQAVASMEWFGPSLKSLLVFFSLDDAGHAFREGGIRNMMVAALALGFFGSIGFHLGPGRSPGETILGLQLIDRNTGSRPAAGGIAVRATASMLSAVLFGAGFLWILVDREHRTWQDCLSNTTVIDFKSGATSTSTVGPDEEQSTA